MTLPQLSMALPVDFSVDGKNYTPLTETERNVERARIRARHAEVEKHLAEVDDAIPEVVVEELSRCLDPTTGFVYWCEHYAYTFDPRFPLDPHKRFILYDYQLKDQETIRKAIKNGGSIHLDKSRDMGATWLMMAIITYEWLFAESFHALMGSRKEDLVDFGTIDDLYGKIDYILERLPQWMLQGYVNESPWRKKMLLKHPETGNVITGESANASFGRGPRKNMVYLDEFAFWEEDQAVWTAVQDTAPCRIATSTPKGESNVFARLRTNSAIIRISQHWTQHPEKDVEWYKNECEKRKMSGMYDTIAIAQELNIDYKASGGRLALPQLHSPQKARIVTPEIRVTDPSNDNSSFYMGLDWGTTNPTSIHVYRVKRLHPDKPIFRIHVCWEYHEPSSMKKIVDTIRGCPYYSRIENIYADPNMWSFNQQTENGKTTSLAFMFRDLHNMYLTPGRRGDTLALQNVEQMWGDFDDPRFTIGENCVKMIQEWEGLKYEKLSPFMELKRNFSEKLVDKDNHSWDDFKYFLNSLIDGPLEEIKEPPPLMGWAAMNKEIGELKGKVLRNLNRPKVRKRFA